MRRAFFLLLSVAFTCVPLCAKAPKTLAVIDFQNVTKNLKIDWLGTGIAENLVTNLASVRGISMVERAEMHSILKELNFGRSQYVDPATAQKIGKVVGANYMVVGAYQSIEDRLRLNARLVEVETGKVLLPTTVDGQLKDVFTLEDRLAANLKKGIGASLSGEAETPFETPTTSLDAFRLFSDGVYFYREGLVKEALDNLDGALKLDPRYSLAHFYRGLTLEKQKQWEEASRSFGQALLGAEGVSREKWTWQVPYETPGSKRALGAIQATGELEGEKKGKKKAEEEEEVKFLPDVSRLVFGEKEGKTAVLYFVDPLHHLTTRIVLPDPKLVDWLGGGQFGAGGKAVLSVIEHSNIEASSEYRLYGIDTDQGTLLWNGTLENYATYVRWDVTSKSFYLDFSGQFYARDILTGHLKWQHSSKYGAYVPCPLVSPDGSEAGELIVLTFQPPAGGKGSFTFFQGEDGKELWRITGDVRNWFRFTVNKTEVIYDIKARTLIGYAALTGEKRFEISVPLEARSVGEGLPWMSKPAMVEAIDRKAGMLYAAGKDKGIYALAVGDQVRSGSRILWKAPMEDKPKEIMLFRERVFVITDKGKALTLNRATGKVEAEAKLKEESVSPVYIQGDLGVLWSERRLIGVDLHTLETKWEYKVTNMRLWDGAYMEGMIVFPTGKKDVTAVDVSTGEVLWRHSGEKSPLVIPGKNSVYVADISGVQEYLSPKSAKETSKATSLAKPEVLAQIANCDVELNRLDDAEAMSRKVLRELDPDYPEAHRVLARVYGQKKDLKNALTETMAYYRLLSPQSERAQQIIEDLKRNFNLQWRTLEGIPSTYPPPQASGSLWILPGDPEEFAALDLSQGAFDWHQKVDNLGNWTVSALSQKIYFIARESEDAKAIQIWQAEATTGEKKMLASIDLPIGLGSPWLQVSGQRLFISLHGNASSSDRRLWRLDCTDPASGKVLWNHTRESGSNEWLSGVVANDQQVLMALGNTLVVLSAEDGHELAKLVQEAPNFGVFASPSGHDFYLLSNRRIGAYDRGTNKITWLLDLPEGDNVVNLDKDFMRGTTFYWGTAHEVVADDLNKDPSLNQRERWRYHLPADHRVERISVVGDKIYCLRDDDTLTELDAESGRLLAEYPLLWDASYFLVKGNVFYGLSSDGYAYAMKLAPLAGLP
jgi:TolB-like protein/outer membrane protein assembly factor BamB